MIELGVTGEKPTRSGSSRTALDVGTGASLIYPILGIKEYGWSFVATDLDERSLKVAGAIAKYNPTLTKHVELRRQKSPTAIFHGVVRPGERFDFTLCNPPFFADASGARHAAERKWAKLGQAPTAGHNFGGRPNELWTPGGEPAFLRRMILESAEYREQVGWFTTLVSKKGYLRSAKELLGRRRVAQTKIISIGQGGKIRRILAWRY